MIEWEVRSGFNALPWENVIVAKFDGAEWKMGVPQIAIDHYGQFLITGAGFNPEFDKWLLAMQDTILEIIKPKGATVH